MIARNAPADVAPRLTLVAPLRTTIDVIPEPETAERAAARPEESPRPTLARPQLGATGLFQGWGPRLR